MKIELDDRQKSIGEEKVARYIPPGKTKWFKKAIQTQTDGIIWSKPYMLPEDDTPGITALIALKNEGKPDGFLAFDISFALLSKELEKATSQLRISNEKLEDFSQRLTDKVEERTAELNEKSEELKELNRTLEQKVIAEVEASVKKDEIMLQSARQAQMGEMISMIAHQWRQPLSSISTVTGNMLVFLELENFDTEQFIEMLNAINNHAQYLSSTINDFRNCFKPNKEMQTVNLNDTLKQTISVIGKSQLP